MLIGRELELGQVVAALAADVSVVLEGPPGTSKSTLTKHALAATDKSAIYVSGSADVTPARLVGAFDPARVMTEGYHRELFEPGSLIQAMISGRVLVIEELNRLQGESLNLLIPAVSDRSLHVPRVGTFDAQSGFCVVATMNPLTDVGTTRVGDAFRDRWCSLWIDYQSEVEECQIVRQEVPQADPDLVGWAVTTVRATRDHPSIRQGASVRAAIDLAKLSLVSDLKREQLAIMALRSRIIPLSSEPLERENLLTEIVSSGGKKNGGVRR